MTYFWLKDQKSLLKDRKKSIKRLKKSNLIQKVNINQLFWLNSIKFDHFQYIFELFQSLSKFLIKSGRDLIDFVMTKFFFGFQDFGSKILIKWWYESDFSQNLAIGWFNCLSLELKGIILKLCSVVNTTAKKQLWYLWGIFICDNKNWNCG